MMNMQLRKAQHDETRFILRRLQDRVLGLATIHRNLYQATVLSRVDSSRLIEELVQQSLRNSDAQKQGVQIDVTVDEVALYPDQAVPLSLLVTETLTANPDLRAQLAVVRAARAQARSVYGRSLPNVSVSGSAGVTSTYSEITDERFTDPTFGARAEASWTADLWGRIQASIDAAEADLAAIKQPGALSDDLRDLIL